jgi:CDP-diglyceride synthetase
MPNALLLAAHITIALALTITVGVQSAELARLRTGAAVPPTIPTLRAALWSTPVLALLTFITGAAVIADGGRRGPWVGAGVLSTLMIALASVWLHRRLRRHGTCRTGVLGAVQWGVPAMTLAAAFLMADRPQNLGVAIAPVIVAVAVTAFAYLTAARSVTT